MSEIRDGFLVLTGMFTFMCIFPTTFLVVMDGVHLVHKVLKQMYPTIGFF